MAKREVPYGQWPSPVDGAMVAGKSLRFATLAASDGWVWWSESRPNEGGRAVLMRARPDGSSLEEMLPGPYSANSRVHEYGGGAFCLTETGAAFVNDADQDLYGVDGGGVTRLTDTPHVRFGDLQFDPAHNRIFAVAERQTDGAEHPENLIVSVALEPRSSLIEHVTGHDFFGQIRVSGDGKRLAWLAWDLPDMPWDQAALYVAEFDTDGRPGNPVHIAGGNRVAAFQPEWDADGSLWYVSDETGFGRLYRRDGDTTTLVDTPPGELLRPLWQFHAAAYALSPTGEPHTSIYRDGNPVITVAGIDTPAKLRSLDDPASTADGVAGHGTFDSAPHAIVHVGAHGLSIIRRSAEIEVPAGTFSPGEVIRFPGAHDEQVTGLYYPPVHPDVTGPRAALPPAIITAHGGPTGMADRGLKLKTQFWTSRGFGVFDIDYSGSAGYGRAYRERLDGEWGVRDVADVVAAARFLGADGRADPEKIAITGGSAGGYTVLMALATSNVFAAGGCHYGISDLAQLLKCTHKFESGYLYRLLGVTPDDRPDIWEAVFAARSPLNLAGQISNPTIFFQGADDAVVPPEQSRMMVEALKANNIATAYHEFPGERHGFRKSETITTVLEAELAFFRTHLAL